MSSLSLLSSLSSDKNDAINKFMSDARNMTIEEIRRIKNVRIFILSTLFKGLQRLVLCGFTTAAGVCVMHYVGMEAMVFDGKIEWNHGIVAASVLIAIIAASAAMWILYRLLSFFPKMEILRFLCSVIAAIAVNGMHYCGQAAATFHYKPGYVSSLNLAPSNLVDQQLATVVAIAVSVIFLFFVLVLSISDLRM
jgi:NO-binding membrane sensor protein with MHYT domain